MKAPNISTLVFILAMSWIPWFSPVKAQEGGQPYLTKAEICEEFAQGECVYPTRLVPISAGKVFCYTSFDSIRKNMVVYHRWYQRDQLSASFTLKLKGPSYATVSSIQLRDTDKGPWKVEVVDQNGHVYVTLRFSVVD